MSLYAIAAAGCRRGGRENGPTAFAGSPFRPDCALRRYEQILRRPLPERDRCVSLVGGHPPVRRWSVRGAPQEVWKRRSSAQVAGHTASAQQRGSGRMALFWDCRRAKQRPGRVCFPSPAAAGIIAGVIAASCRSVAAGARRGRSGGHFAREHVPPAVARVSPRGVGGPLPVLHRQGGHRQVQPACFHPAGPRAPCRGAGSHGHRRSQHWTDGHNHSQLRRAWAPRLCHPVPCRADAASARRRGSLPALARRRRTLTPSWTRWRAARTCRRSFEAFRVRPVGQVAPCPTPPCAAPVTPSTPAVLVVDEVSMLDQTLFELLERIARAARGKSPAARRPFGGACTRALPSFPRSGGAASTPWPPYTSTPPIAPVPGRPGLQVILTGDFHQLPPVARPGKPAKFCFESPTFEAAVPVQLELTHVFRQARCAHYPHPQASAPQPGSRFSLRAFAARPAPDRRAERDPLRPLQRRHDGADAVAAAGASPAPGARADAAVRRQQRCGRHQHGSPPRACRPTPRPPLVPPRNAHHPPLPARFRRWADAATCFQWCHRRGSRTPG